MPTQQQVEYYRKKHQQFTPFKAKVSVFISLLSNVALAPLELLKVRAQLLQEGRKLHGFGTERGSPMVRNFTAVIDSGAGLRGLWTGFDTLFARSVWYGTFRSYLWCLCYNKVNKDPRRSVHWSIAALSSFSAGFMAGVITNPIDIVYNRQAADALYPDFLKRNYANFIDGLLKVNAEGALFRGAVASGFSYGVLLASMSTFYDHQKEYWYWFFGPTEWLRPMILIPTTLLGTCLYLPFDNMKVRYHTMMALPNGEMPYQNFFDAVGKVMKYEGNIRQHSSVLALCSGGAPAYIRLYLSLFAGIQVTDYYYYYNEENTGFYEPSTIYSPPRPGFIKHESIQIKGGLDSDYSQKLGPDTRSYLKYA